MSPASSSSLSIFNNSACSLAYSVSTSGETWLDVTPFGGSLSAFDDATLNLAINRTLPPGEGVFTAYIFVEGPNNSLTITVTVQRGGNPPTISSATGVCSSFTPTLPTNWTASVTDDVGIESVRVTYTAVTNSVVTLQLDRPTSGSTWTGSGLGAKHGTYQVTATDYAGNTSQRSVTPTGGCLP